MTSIIDPAVREERAARATRRLRQRHNAERRFRWYGIAAVTLALSILAVLVGTIARDSLPAFTTTEITLTVTLDPAVIDPDKTGKREDWLQADYSAIVLAGLQKLFPDVSDRRGRIALLKLTSAGARDVLRDTVMADPAMIGKTITVRVPAATDVSRLHGGSLTRAAAAAGPLTAQQLEFYDKLRAAGAIHRAFNTRFFTAGASREPELAGIRAALIGSFLTLVVTLALSFPLGVTAAIYLQEFAPKNRWTDLIEVNINNLAAVPSIVFGLLGLAVFLNYMELPRSAPLVGGMVLALMTLPTIIIAARTAMQSVPPSIREAAVGLGASPLQVVVHHVAPLAMPGILTGAIIGMARALGETAPLLMIGMVAFIVDAPTSPLSPSTVLPVQVYLWADSPERAFVAKTAAAVLVLLVFLVVMNGIAIYLRKKFERRW